MSCWYNTSYTLYLIKMTLSNIKSDILQAALQVCNPHTVTISMNHFITSRCIACLSPIITFVFSIFVDLI